MNPRISRASAVVVQRVPAAAVDWFLDWQRGVTTAAEAFPGYCGTDLYPPGDSQREEWVVVMHFEDENSLQRWVGSSVRAQWVEKLRAKAGDFELKILPGGFGAWFVGHGGPGAAPPPGWKMMLTVLFGLYPTVMLLGLVVGPYTAPLGLAVSVLIGNALSCCILQWAVMPVLNRLLAPWLQSDPRRQAALSFGGLVLILAILAIQAVLFRKVTG